MRTSGILMPIFSLPSPHGIGNFGKEAYRFIDFLADAGQTIWQILPMNPTDYGNSPYQSPSSFAGNPFFIDPDALVEEGLITEFELSLFDFGSDHRSVDYEKLIENRPKMLSLAHGRFRGGEEYEKFCRENAYWLDDYVLFMALKDATKDAPFNAWDATLRDRDPDALAEARKKYADKCALHSFIQFCFYKQWSALKKYANEKGVYILGDIPIYVAYDSADVWGDPSQFWLDNKLTPCAVGGCPPDAFSEDGQMWGNPLYRWNEMKKDGYTWWKKRLGFALKIYDAVRIDHFRGLESYFAIPYGDKNAKNGFWKKGPGMSFFREMRREFSDDLPIVAEDLGYLTPAVLKLLKDTGFPGMKVLQFAFDGRPDNDYLPHNHVRNCVVYTGTHDNNTILGWCENADEAEVKLAREYLRANETEGFNWTMMRAAMMSVADTCILTMQDLSALSSEARTNEPATVGKNWEWRIEGGYINSWLSRITREMTELYGRLSPAYLARIEAEKETEKEGME